jgi:Tfp pilus assembly protein PilO
MNHKYTAFGILSLAVLLSLVLLNTLVVPRWQEYQSQSQELARYRTLTSAAKNYDNLRTELTTTKERLNAKLTGLTAGLGDANDLSALLQMLIGKAKEADIRFVRMEPQQQSIAADFIRYPVVLDLSTTYHSLGKFIASLEASPQTVRVNRLALSATAGGAVTVRLLVTCYLQVNAGS